MTTTEAPATTTTTLRRAAPTTVAPTTSTTTCSPYRRCGLPPIVVEPPTPTPCTWSYELTHQPSGGATIALQVRAPEKPNTDWTAKLYIHGNNAQRAWDLGRTDDTGQVDFTLTIDPDVMGKQVDIESDSQMVPEFECSPGPFTFTLPPSA